MFNWVNFITYVLITAITPGPNNIMSMTCGGQLGFKRAFPFNLGVWAGFSVVMLLCAAFCSALSSFIPKIKPIMLVIGAAYMLWLAWKTWRSKPEIEENHAGRGFSSGLALQFVNVKIYLYGILSMEAYILPVYDGQLLIVAAFALFLATAGFLCTLLWSAFGSVFKVLFSKYAKITNAIMALALVYCAVALFL